MIVCPAFGTDIYSLAIAPDYSIEESLEHSESDRNQHYVSDSREVEPERAVNSIPTLHAITVSYNGNNNTNSVEYYLRYVVPSELSPFDPSVYTGMSYAYLLEAFKAQAVASRGYANCRAAWHDRHNGTGYDVCATTCCQVYNPSYTNTISLAAISATANQIMCKGANNTICDTLFFASCDGSTKNYEDVFNGGPISYLVSVFCPFEPTPNSLTGHGVGLCQTGAVGLAGYGFSYSYILTHYYSGASVVTANPAP